MSIVERIRDSASEKGLTLAKIEKLLGFGNSTIRKWDQNSPSLDKVIAIASLLNKPLAWLATGEPVKPGGKPSEFLIQYEKLSDVDKRKIEYFMEISLLRSMGGDGPFGGAAGGGKVSGEDASGGQAFGEAASGGQVPGEAASGGQAFSGQASHMMEPAAGYGDGSQGVAVLGYVADERLLEGLSVPIGYTPAPKGADYALIARGSGMEPVILNGEYIYVKNCSRLSPGDLGIFYVGGELKCMAYHPAPDQLTLLPPNPGLSPLCFPSPWGHSCKIQGRVLLTREQAWRLPG